MFSFHWNRLDYAAADALKHLLTKKLREVLIGGRVATSTSSEEATTTTASHSHSPTSSSMSIVDEIEVTDLKWGQVPPFVELLTMLDALDFGDNPGSAAALNAAGGGLDPSVRLGSSGPLGPCPPVEERGGATNTISSANRTAGVTPQPSTATCSGPPLPLPSSLSTSFADMTGGARRGRCESTSPAGSTTTATAAHAAGGGDVDTLAPFFGPKGLFVKFHVTYGGTLSITLRCTVKVALPLGGASLVVRLPISTEVSHVGIDGNINLNFHHNALRVWLEPTALSESPITKLGVVTSIGSALGGGYYPRGNSESGSGGVHHHHHRHRHHHKDNNVIGTSSGHLGGTLEVPRGGGAGTGFSDGDTIGEDDCVFVDERAISSFVLHELKSILDQQLIAPHYAQIPMRL